MQWQDEAIVIGTRRHGENSIILEVMTLAHGRHMGLVRGGRSRRMQPILQPGNRIDVVWRARLDEQLGNFQAEPVTLHAGRLIGLGFAVFGLQLAAAHLRLLPERDPHPQLYRMLRLIVDHLDDAAAAAELMARFELMMLEDLGFGLDLDSCAATGTTQELVYVSPKSGRAVSREAGSPWADRLLPLPGFLTRGERTVPDAASLAGSFRLTGYFLMRHVWEPRGLPEPPSRASFIAAAARHLPGLPQGLKP